MRRARTAAALTATVVGAIALAAAFGGSAGPGVSWAPPALAGDSTPPGVEGAKWKEWTAVVDEWFAAEGDAAKVSVEAKSAKLDALPESAVAPLAARIFDLAGKTGPKLKKTGKAYFYDEKSKKGLYMVGPAAKRPCGLLIAMHGGGEGVGDAGGAFGTWGGATGEGFTVIAPEVMTKVSSAWNEEAEERMVLELIEAAKRTFPVDTNRICLAGHSMGGDGSWMIGGRNADLFAGCAPLAGSVMPYMKGEAKNRRDTKLTDYLGLMEGVLPNLMHVPYWIAHSADDRNEAIHPDDIATGRLKELQALHPGRYEFNYDRIDGNGHALPPKGVGPIIEWLAKKTRVVHPTEVVWETWWPWKRDMYWLHCQDPKDAWRFHAKVVAPNHVEVSGTSKLLQGRTEPKELELSLLLSPKMFDLSKPLKVTNGAAVLFEGTPQRSLWALLVSAARRNDPERWFEAAVTVRIPRSQWRDAWETK